MIFGWQFFGTVLLLLLLGGWFFRDPLVQESPAEPAREPVAGRRALAWPVALVVLVAAPLAALALAPGVPPDALTITAPMLAGWQGPDATEGSWQPHFTGAAGQVRVDYHAANGLPTVGFLHAVYVGKPRRGHDLVTYGNDVYDPASSRVLATADRRVSLAGGKTREVRELRLAGADGPRLVWYWYCVNTHCTTSPVWTKLLQGAAVLRGGTLQSAVWAVSAPVANHDDAGVRGELAAFVRALAAVGSNATLRSGGAHGGRP